MTTKWEGGETKRKEWEKEGCVRKGMIPVWGWREKKERKKERKKRKIVRVEKDKERNKEKINKERKNDKLT